GHGGSSIYHALQTQLVSRFGKGSQFQASYTWSRTIGTVSLAGGEGGIGATSISLLENPRLGRGLTRTHPAHTLHSNLVPVLPALEELSAFVKNVLGGWEIGTIVQASSGSPLTVYTGRIPGLSGGVSGTGFAANQRPNRVAGQPCRATSGPPEQWLNPNAWT